MTIIRSILAAIASLFGMLMSVPIILLGFPFWVIAFLTRVFSRLFRKRAIPWQKIIEFYPTIGWKPKANLNAYALGQDSEIFHFTTDSEGWRGKNNIEKSEIVVFGDSFAFGFAADDGVFFAELNHKLCIKAIGACGYNMVQSLLWMERLSSKLKGKLVIWFIYYGNDLYENLQPNLDHYRMPFVREVNGAGKWEIVTSHIRPDRWFYTPERRYYDRLSEICCRTFLSERAYSACEFLIRKGNDICKDEGAKLVVMTIPEVTQLNPNGLKLLSSLAPDPASFDPDLPDKKISEICLRLDIPFIALKNHLTVTDYKVRDCHWNEKGHKRIAEVLYSLYQGYLLKNVELFRGHSIGTEI